MLLDHPFDCCVLDLRLPDMTGFALLEKMQAEPALRDIPVVVFTGKKLKRGGRKPTPRHGQEHRAEGCSIARTAVR